MLPTKETNTHIYKYHFSYLHCTSFLHIVNVCKKSFIKWLKLQSYVFMQIANEKNQQKKNEK